MKEGGRRGMVGLKVFDPRQGDLAFKLRRGRIDGQVQAPQRSNYFTAILVRSGVGRFHVDLAAHSFHGPALLFSSPYQLFWMENLAEFDGAILQFHANFFCIETYHKTVGCNGVLFNDVYGEPVVALDETVADEFEQLLDQMERECRGEGVARDEILVSYLKVFLIKATRLKLEQQGSGTDPAMGAKRTPEVLERLTHLIEEHYRTKRSPADYSSMLHMSGKALGKLVRTHWHKTLTDLIRERVLRDAKWQLLHTRKPVKEVAWELGFADEFYFSRLFKQATGFAPTAFREFETEIRGGRNLSMQ